MSTADRGFGSLSAAKRKAVAAKGGRTAHLMKTAHTFNSVEAKAAATRAVLARKSKAAKAAAVRLMADWGFQPAQLVSLTIEELMHYGGPQTTKAKVDELRTRVGG